MSSPRYTLAGLIPCMTRFGLVDTAVPVPMCEALECTSPMPWQLHFEYIHLGI